MQSCFSGVWLPILTPFHHDRIDHPALAQLAQDRVAQGVAGLVAGATTGEGVLLHPGEQEAIFATLRTAVPNTPIVLGVTQFASHAAVAQARSLAALAPDGLLVTPPSYVRPSQDGMRRHFEAVAEASDLPLLIYDIPYRTGASLSLDTLQALSQDPRIAGIKACGCTVERWMQLIHATRLQVLCGDDSQNFTALCLGAHGTIAASAHVLTRWHVRLQAQIAAEQLNHARQIAVALDPLIQLLFAEPNPAPLKALLARSGECRNALRAPFAPVSAGLDAKLWDVHQSVASGLEGLMR